MYICIYVYVYIHTYICMYIYIHIYIYIYICVCVCVYKYIIYICLKYRCINETSHIYGVDNDLFCEIYIFQITCDVFVLFEVNRKIEQFFIT